MGERVNEEEGEMEKWRAGRERESKRKCVGRVRQYLQIGREGG